MNTRDNDSFIQFRISLWMITNTVNYTCVKTSLTLKREYIKLLSGRFDFLLKSLSSLHRNSGESTVEHFVTGTHAQQS